MLTLADISKEILRRDGSADQPRRLLIRHDPRDGGRFAPRAGESLRGAIARATCQAGLPNTWTFLGEIGLKHRNRVLVSEDLGIDIGMLAEALGVPREEIISRRYEEVGKVGRSYFGLVVPTGSIETNRRRFAPTFLKDHDHHLACWELKFLPFCPVTWDLLVSSCTLCQSGEGKSQGWTRTRTQIDRCDECGRKLSRMPSEQVPTSMRSALEVLARLVDPDTETRQNDAADALPVVLTVPSMNAMQDQITGRLLRRGPCLYLDSGAGPRLILWRGEVAAARRDPDGWLIANRKTQQEFREGDWLTGTGKSWPEGSDVEAPTPQEVPFECEGGTAIQLGSVRVTAPPDLGDIPAPPVPPPAPSIIESVTEASDAGGKVPTYRLRGIPEPREALFVHVVGTYRESGNLGTKPICLTDADANMVRRVGIRFEDIHPDTRCGWRDGGVILKDTGAPAVFVHAKIRCEDGACAGESGATYGNLGGEGHGYRLRRLRDGWSIEQTGISWIS